MDKKVLTMPLKEEDVRELKIGDVVYLTGHIFTKTADDFGYAKNRTFVVTKAMNLVSRLDTEHIRNRCV